VSDLQSPQSLRSASSYLAPALYQAGNGSLVSCTPCSRRPIGREGCSDARGLNPKSLKDANGNTLTVCHTCYDKYFASVCPVTDYVFDRNFDSSTSSKSGWADWQAWSGQTASWTVGGWRNESDCRWTGMVFRRTPTFRLSPGIRYGYQLSLYSLIDWMDM
jgi:hypothetical protein